MTSITNSTERDVNRRPYSPPLLTFYGRVAEITQNGAGTTAENNGSPGQCNPNKPITEKCSLREMKENISLVGKHPMGIGLYTFDYKPEYREYAGYGRQFGVMIDEVVAVNPEAVRVDLNGYPVVDYTMLGIHLPH